MACFSCSPAFRRGISVRPARTGGGGVHSIRRPRAPTALETIPVSTHDKVPPAGQADRPPARVHRPQAARPKQLPVPACRRKTPLHSPSFLRSRRNRCLTRIITFNRPHCLARHRATTPVLSITVYHAKRQKYTVEFSQMVYFFYLLAHDITQFRRDLLAAALRANLHRRTGRHRSQPDGAAAHGQT